MSDSKYFIRVEYQANPVMTYNFDGVEKYWNGDRIRKSSLYQFHVYELAYRYATKHDCKSIVDFGCGPATKARMFFNDFDVTLVDQESISKVVQNIFPAAKFLPCNLEYFSNEIKSTYDLLICSDVIEHLENPIKLLEGMYGIMNANSVLILSTPDRDVVRGLNNLKSPNPQHVREWNKAELKKFVTSIGYKVLDHLNLPQMRMNKLDHIQFKILNLIGHRVDKKLFGNQVLLLKR